MTIYRVLASMCFVALFTVPAAVHAGGMGGSGGAVAFECYAGSGASPSGTVTLTDDLPSSRQVTLGALRLVCTPVTSTGWTGDKAAAQPGGCDPINPAPDCGNHLKCYDVRPTSGGAPSSANLTLTDFFFDDALTTATRTQMLCVGAAKTQ